MSSTETPYECEMIGNQAVITLSESLNNVQWKAIDEIGGELVQRLEALRKPVCVVDLSNLNYMGSAMVALVVRMWKSLDSRNGRMVVINRDANVLEVLRLAGLTKVWTITDNREEALQQVGASRGGAAGGSAGEGAGASIPAIAGIVLVLVAGAALGTLFAGSMQEQRGAVVGVLFVAAGLGALLGLISAIRGSGSLRAMGVVAALAGLTIVGYGVAGLPDFAPGPQPEVESREDSDSSEEAGSEETGSEETGSEETGSEETGSEDSAAAAKASAKSE